MPPPPLGIESSCWGRKSIVEGKGKNERVEGKEGEAKGRQGKEGKEGNREVKEKRIEGKGKGRMKGKGTS